MLRCCATTHTQGATGFASAHHGTPGTVQHWQSQWHPCALSYKAGTTSSVKDVNEPVLEFLTVSVILSVHWPLVLVPSW
jgi:hypothetical protein